MTGFAVAAPRNIVSLAPRARSSRSVKTWPRSRSAISWISSTARNSTSRAPTGIASVVQTCQRAPGGTMRSSPVTSATLRSPFRRTMRS